MEIFIPSIKLERPKEPAIKPVEKTDPSKNPPEDEILRNALRKYQETEKSIDTNDGGEENEETKERKRIEKNFYDGKGGRFDGTA